MSELIDPAGGVSTVVPSDITTLAGCRALYIGGAGNLSVVAVNTNAVVPFFNVQAGTILPVRARKVMATGTTATNIVAMT